MGMTGGQVYVHNLLNVQSLVCAELEVTEKKSACFAMALVYSNLIYNALE